MRSVDRLRKKLFGFRKIVWLFLCGMVMIAGETGAQQGDRRDKGSIDGNQTTITQPVVKYGPPSSLRPPPSVLKYGPPSSWDSTRPVVKYGPPSSFKPDLEDKQTPDQGKEVKGKSESKEKE